MRAAVLNRIVMILSFAGVVIAGVLTYFKFKHIIPPCGESTGCEKVLNHPSSEWFGIPVAAFGLLAYLTILAIAVIRVYLRLESTQKLGLLSYWISLVGAMASLGLQVFSGTVIHDWCKWCIASAVTMILLFITQAALYQTLAGEQAALPEGAGLEKRKKVDLWVVAVAAVASLIAFVWLSGLGGSGKKSYVVEAAMVPKLVPEDANIRGPKDAQITIVEFGDLCCPSCAAAYTKLSDAIKGREDKIRVVFRHFPLMNVHPEAFRAAVYSEFAGTKGHFWDFVDKAYQSGPEAAEKKETFENILFGLGMDVGEAEKQFADNKSIAFDRVYRDYQMANTLGVQVTPTFFIYSKDEQPHTFQIDDLRSTLDGNEKYAKLLGSGGG